MWFSKKSSISSILAVVVALVVVSAGSLLGCAKDSQKNVINTETSKSDANVTPLVKQEDGQVKIMADFKALLANNAEANQIAQFMDQTISQVSKENASIMLMGFEDTQKKDLPKLDAEFSTDDSISKKMSKVYKPGFDIYKIDFIEDNELKDFLIKTRDSGFKVETAEGTFFPIINYEFYKKYNSNVTTDIKDYIDIMAVESNKVPAKDAALMISWQEILERALNQEKFIKNHRNSTRANEVKLLLNKYLSFTLYGTNNTPLFSYETKIMKPEAKNAYLNAVKNNGDSVLIKVVNKFMETLNTSNYKLTDPIEKFRKDAVEHTTF